MSLFGLKFLENKEFITAEKPKVPKMIIAVMRQISFEEETKCAVGS